jgi:hypothetical protein
MPSLQARISASCAEKFCGMPHSNKQARIAKEKDR